MRIESGTAGPGTTPGGTAAFTCTRPANLLRRRASVQHLRVHAADAHRNR